MQEYKGFKSVINNSMPVPKEWSGTDEEGILFNELPESQQEAITDYYRDLKKDIQLGDKKHVERHGTSYVDFQHEGLFGKKPPSQPPPPGVKDGEKEVKIEPILESEIEAAKKREAPSTKKGYEEYSPPRSSKESKDVATALGEKNYTDVKKKYLSANPSTSFPTAWRATNIKREDTDKSLSKILADNDIDTSYISSYLAENKVDERDFQKYLDNLDSGKDAREILYKFAPSTYKLQEGIVSAVMANIPGSRAVPIGDGQGRIVGGRKRGNKKAINKAIANYKTVGDFESLTLLYEYIAAKGKV